MSRTCPECEGSTHLSWQMLTDTNSGVADGRLRMNDILVKAFLGCEYCSETIEVINADEIAIRLNKLDGIAS